ncbi:MAG: GRAM domain-containing protein [Flavobacteriaceae bacterium]
MEKISLKHKIFLIVQFILIYGVVLTLINLILLNQELSEKLIIKTLIESVVVGISLGLGLPYLMKKLAPQMIKNVKTPELKETENIIMEGGANLFRNKLIAVGGKLFLSNKRLIFNSHKYNFQMGETSIRIEKIEKITLRKTGRIVDNGLRIETNDNLIFDFVVNDREKWVKKIHEQKNALKQPIL